jgi:thioredoxin-dependent peroxiredoxin
MRDAVRIVLMCMAAVGALAIGAAAQLPPAPGQPELKAGDQAPDFTLQATDGKTYSLSKLRGKPVVLAWFPKAFTAG